MLIIPVLRVVVLLLLLTILIDGATGQHYSKGWELLIWDEKPDLPAGFFDLLRVVFSISLAWDAWTHTKYARLGFSGSKGWTVVLAMLLIVYQPILPVHFSYHWWLWIDLFCLCVLFVHTFFVSRPLLELLGGIAFEGGNLLSASQHKMITATFQGYTDAAALLANPVQYISDEPEKPSKAPEERLKPTFEPTSQKPDHLGRVVLDPLSSNPMTRALNAQKRAAALLANPELPPEKRANVERVAKMAEHQIARQRKLQQTNDQMSNSSTEAQLMRSEAQVVRGEMILANPDLTPEKRAAAELALAGAKQLHAIRKARQQATKP